jgi:hypothetical protein
MNTKGLVIPSIAHRITAVIRIAAIALTPLVQCCGGGGGDFSVPGESAPLDTATAAISEQVAAVSPESPSQQPSK